MQTELSVCMCLFLCPCACVCLYFCVCVCGCESGCPGDTGDILFSTGLPLQKRTKAFCPRL